MSQMTETYLAWYRWCSVYHITTEQQYYCDKIHANIQHVIIYDVHSRVSLTLSCIACGISFPFWLMQFIEPHTAEEKGKPVLPLNIPALSVFLQSKRNCFHITKAVFKRITCCCKKKATICQRTMNKLYVAFTLFGCNWCEFLRVHTSLFSLCKRASTAPAVINSKCHDPVIVFFC